MMNIIMGVVAVLALLGVAFLLSEDKKKINWKNAVMALCLQFIFMFLVIKLPAGQWILEKAANGVTTLLNYGQEGISFVFGGISSEFVFGINVLGLICFTSALISVLYYFRVIPVLVRTIGRVISKVLGTSEVESFCAVGNAFLGATEAPLLTKPYLAGLSRSELFCVVVGGFSSVAVSVIGGYAMMGLDMKYILVAMATVPFATILVSKIIIPETEDVAGKEVDINTTSHSNLFDAIGAGACEGAQLAFNVGAVLIGFLGLVAVLNGFLGMFGTSLSEIMGYLLTPIAWLFNIPGEETRLFASLIGSKTAINEYVAIADLGQVINTITPRTQAILSVVLMNFANFSVIGITTAGFRAFCPSRAKEVAGLGFKALTAGLITTLVTGALIGMLF